MTRQQQQRIHQHNLYDNHHSQQQSMYSEHQQQIATSDVNTSVPSQFLDSTTHASISSPSRDYHRQQQVDQVNNLVTQQQQADHSVPYVYQQEPAQPQLVDQNISQEFHTQQAQPHQAQNVEFVGADNTALHQRLHSQLKQQPQHIVDQQQYQGLEDLAELAQLSQQHQQQFISSGQRSMFQISGNFFLFVFEYF